MKMIRPVFESLPVHVRLRSSNFIMFLVLFTIFIESDSSRYKDYENAYLKSNQKVAYPSKKSIIMENYNDIGHGREDRLADRSPASHRKANTPELNAFLENVLKAQDELKWIDRTVRRMSPRENRAKSYNSGSPRYVKAPFRDPVRVHRFRNRAKRNSNGRKISGITQDFQKGEQEKRGNDDGPSSEPKRIYLDEDMRLKRVADSANFGESAKKMGGRYNNAEDWTGTANNDGNTRDQRDISFLRISTDVEGQFPSGNSKVSTDNNAENKEVPSLEYLKKTVLELSKSLMENDKRANGGNEIGETLKTVDGKEEPSRDEGERLNALSSRTENSNNVEKMIDDSSEKNTIGSRFNWWEDPRSGAEIFNFRRREDDPDDEDESEAEDEHSDLDYVMQRVKRAKEDGVDEGSVKVFYRSGFGESYLDEDHEEPRESKRRRRESSDDRNENSRQAREAKLARDNDTRLEENSSNDSKDVLNGTNIVGTLTNNSDLIRENKTMKSIDKYANETQELKKVSDNVAYESSNNKDTLKSSSKRIRDPEVSGNLVDVQTDVNKILKGNNSIDFDKNINSTYANLSTEDVHLAGIKEDGSVNKDRESISNEKSSRTSNEKLNAMSKAFSLEFKTKELEKKSRDAPKNDRKCNLEEGKNSEAIDQNLENSREVEKTEPKEEEHENHLKEILQDKNARKEDSKHSWHETENGKHVGKIRAKFGEGNEKSSTVNSSTDLSNHQPAKSNETVTNTNRPNEKLTADNGNDTKTSKNPIPKIFDNKESKVQVESTKITDDSHTKDESNEGDRMKPREIPNVYDRGENEFFNGSSNEEISNDNEVQVEEDAKLKRGGEEQSKDPKVKNEQPVEPSRPNGADFREVPANDKDAIDSKPEIAVISSGLDEDSRDEKMMDKNNKKRSMVRDWHTDLKRGLQEGPEEPGWYKDLVRNQNGDFQQNEGFLVNKKLELKGDGVEMSNDDRSLTGILNKSDKIKYKNEGSIYEDKFGNDEPSVNGDKKELKSRSVSTMMARDARLEDDEMKERDNRDADKDKNLDGNSKDNDDKESYRDARRKLLCISSSVSESVVDYEDPAMGETNEEINENPEIKSHYKPNTNNERYQNFEKNLQRNGGRLLSIRDTDRQLTGRYRRKRDVFDKDSDLGENFGHEGYLNAPADSVGIRKRSREGVNENAVNRVKSQSKRDAEDDEEKDDILAEESEERPFRHEDTAEGNENDYKAANDNDERIVQNYDEEKEDDDDEDDDESSDFERQERSPSDETNERNILNEKVYALTKQNANPSNEERYRRKRRYPVENVEYVDYDEGVREHEANVPASESNQQKSNQPQNVSVSKNNGTSKKGSNKGRTKGEKDKMPILKDEEEEERKRKGESGKWRNVHPKEQFIADTRLTKGHNRPRNKSSSSVPSARTNVEAENEESHSADLQRVHQADTKVQWSGQPPETDADRKKNMGLDIGKGGPVIPLEYSVNVREKLGPETVGLSLNNGPPVEKQMTNHNGEAHEEQRCKEDNDAARSNDIKSIYEELERVNEWKDGEVKSGLRLRGDQRMYDEVKGDTKLNGERSEAHDDRQSRRSWLSRESDRVNVEDPDLEENFSRDVEPRYIDRTPKGSRFLREVPRNEDQRLVEDGPVEPVVDRRTYFAILPPRSLGPFNPDGGDSSSSGSNYLALKITDDMFKGGVEQSNPTEEKLPEVTVSDMTTTEWKMIEMVEAKNNSLSSATISPLISSKNETIVKTDSPSLREKSKDINLILSNTNFEGINRNEQPALSSKDLIGESFVESMDWPEDFNDIKLRLGRGLKAAENSIFIPKSNEVIIPKLIEQGDFKYSSNESYFGDPEKGNIVGNNLQYFSYPVDEFKRTRVKKQLTNKDWEEPMVQQYSKSSQNSFYAEPAAEILNDASSIENNDEDADIKKLINAKKKEITSVSIQEQHADSISKRERDVAPEKEKVDSKLIVKLDDDKLSERKKNVDIESAVSAVQNQLNSTWTLRDRLEPSRIRVFNSKANLEELNDKNSSRIKRDVPFNNAKYKFGNYDLRRLRDNADLDYGDNIYPVRTRDTNHDWYLSLQENPNGYDYRKSFDPSWMEYNHNNYGMIVRNPSWSKRSRREKLKEKQLHDGKYNGRKSVHNTNLHGPKSNVFHKGSHHKNHPPHSDLKSTSDKIPIKTSKNHGLKSSLNDVGSSLGGNAASKKKHGEPKTNQKTLAYDESNKNIGHRTMPIMGDDKRVQHENAQDQTTFKHENESQKKKFTVLLAVDNMEDESQMDLALHGELAGQIVEKIFEQVQDNEALKVALGPGLYRRHKPEDSVLSDKIFRQGLDEDEVKHTEAMMRRVMELLGRLILDEVQRKTCASLPPDLHEFLQWMLGVEQEETLSGQVPPLPFVHRPDIARCPEDKFLFHEPSEFDSNISMEELYRKVRLLKNLINEYNALTEREKTKVQAVHDYLVRQLEHLVKYIETKEIEATRKKENVIHDGSIRIGNILEYQSPMSSATNSSRSKLPMATLSPLVNTPSILRLSNATFKFNEEPHSHSKFDRVKHREIRSSDSAARGHRKRKNRKRKHHKYKKHKKHKHETPEYKKLLRRVSVLRQKRANLYEDTWDPFDSGYEEPVIYSFSGALTNQVPERKDVFWDETFNILEDESKHKDEVDGDRPYFWLDLSSGKLEGAKDYDLERIRGGNERNIGNGKRRTAKVNEEDDNRGHREAVGSRNMKSNFQDFKDDNVYEEKNNNPERDHQYGYVFDFGGKDGGRRRERDEDRFYGRDEFSENQIFNQLDRKRQKTNVDSDLGQLNYKNSGRKSENLDDTVALDSSMSSIGDSNSARGYVKRKRETPERDENSSKINSDRGKNVRIRGNDEIKDKSEIREETDTSGLRTDDLMGSSKSIKRKKDTLIDLQPRAKFTTRFVKKVDDQLTRPSNGISFGSDADDIMERKVDKRNASNDPERKSARNENKENEIGITSARERNLADDEVILLNKREVWKKKNEQQLEEVAFGKDMRGMPKEKEEFKKLIEMDKKKSVDDIGERKKREDNQRKIGDAKFVNQHEPRELAASTITKKEERQSRPTLNDNAPDDMTLKLRVYGSIPVNSSDKRHGVSDIRVELEKENDYLKKLENRINVYPDVNKKRS